MKQYLIAPSILSADFARLGEDTAKALAAGADVVHFDVMDNHYVPNLTIGPMVLKSLRNYGITAPIDVHLMVKPVDRIVPDFAAAGASIITFHPEASEHVDRTLQLIKENGCKAGLVFNPATPLSYLDYVMDKLDGQFKPLSEFLSRNYLAENGYNLRKRLVVASAIAKAFRQLNHEGLAYCDISPANIMLKLAANAVQIKLIDIDNVCPSGTASYSVGTPRYMAPEVYRREYSPDVLSDDYSLAVLIFQILRCGHPFISPQDEAASFEAEEQAAKALSAAP